MAEPAWLTSGRGVQMESVCPKIIANISDCLLSAQFSSLETGSAHSLAALRKGEEPASCPGATFQVRPGGAVPSPSLGNNSTLKGYKQSALPFIWAGLLSALCRGGSRPRGEVTRLGPRS